MADESEKVIVVTGSTRGIGRVVAATLVEQGVRVVINGRDAHEAQRVAGDLGEGAVGVATDVTSVAGARELIERAQQAFGRIDGLVNNAGIAQIADSVGLREEDWRRVLDLNLSGAFFCAQAAAAAMLDTDGGAIVNVLSIAALTGLPGRAAYTASKAGLLGLTRVLAVEWGPRVRVNAVAPGYVRTELLEALAEQGGVDLGAIERRAPAGRLASPADIAPVVAFLLSDAARYVTGETIAVDGGWLANGTV